VAAALLVVLLLGAGPVAEPAAAGRPLTTAVFDPVEFGRPGGERGLKYVARAGARAVRLTLAWRSVAPARRPLLFDATNPADPAYNWGANNIDGQVRAAVASGLEPILVVIGAPAWAEGPGVGEPGTIRPDTVAFGEFALAAARRYSGSFQPRGGAVLPRVRYWQAWNEPNRGYFLAPQLVGSELAGATLYRELLSRFAGAVRSVHADNLVVTGGLAPYGRRGHPAPLTFMRELLCVSQTRPYRPTCNARSSFDIWSQHPYTAGGPTHSAQSRSDVAIGDLGAVRQVLDAARSFGHIDGRTPSALWVTEFAWDTKRPDPRGVPLALHARWTSEALYRMWRSGVSLVTWFLLEDDPLRQTPYQSGLLFFSRRGVDRAVPKPAHRAFRFPVVAFRRGGGAYVWGRTPSGMAGTVVIERRGRSGWTRIRTVRTDDVGIFSVTVAARGADAVRARFTRTGERSVPFSLRRPRPFRISAPYGPFGCGGTIRC
jgi:hypothetical protein